MKIKDMLYALWTKMAVDQSLTIRTGVKAYKRGNVVTITVSNIVPTSTTERTLLGTLPEGWRPPDELYAANISGNTGYADVLPNGKIEAFRPTRGRVDAFITYAVKWGDTP